MLLIWLIACTPTEHREEASPSVAKTHEQLMPVLLEAEKELGDCYRNRVLSKPDVTEAWELKFSVVEDGSAADVTVTPRGGPTDDTLVSCVTSLVSEWEFAPVYQPIPVTRRYNWKEPDDAGSP